MMKRGRQFALALAFAALGVPASGSEFEDLVCQGLTALEAGKLERAREHLEKASRIEDEDARLWLGLAHVYRLIEEPVKAETALRRAVEFGPSQPGVARGLAMYFEEQGDFRKAAEFEARYARVFRDDPETFLRTANYYLKAGRPDLAAEFALSGLERAENGKLRFVLGEALLRSDDLRGAEEALRAAARLEPYDEDVHVALGRVLLRKGDFPGALEAYREGRRFFDKSVSIAVGLGRAQYGLRRFDSAAEALIRASELAPTDDTVHYLLLRVLGRAKVMKTRVAARLRNYSELEADGFLGPYIEARLLLSGNRAVKETETVARAEAAFRKSISREGRFWESRFQLGLLLIAGKRWREARAPLERAAALAPAEPGPREALRRTYAKLGEKERADEERAVYRRLRKAANAYELPERVPIQRPRRKSAVR